MIGTATAGTARPRLPSLCTGQQRRKCHHPLRPPPAARANRLVGRSAAWRHRSPSPAANATAYTCSIGQPAMSGVLVRHPQLSMSHRNPNVPFALIRCSIQKLHAGAGDFRLAIDAGGITGNITVRTAYQQRHAPPRVPSSNGLVMQTGTTAAVDANNVAIGASAACFAGQWWW